MITWRHDGNNQLMTDTHDLEKIMKKGGRPRRKKKTGGYLRGPSHEQGGIMASTNGEMVELEGGEYIINAQTANALGTQFLDKLNSTQTSYHTGGYRAGQLPGPSQYKRGGVIRKKQMGGRTSCPPGTHMMPDGTCMQGITHPGGGYRKGGRTNKLNGRNKMRRGGRPTMRRGGRPIARTTMRQGGKPARRMRSGGRPVARTAMRRGGRTMRKMPHGGPHNGNGCPAGMVMQNGGCVPAGNGGGYRTGGRVRQMPHGGHHNGGQVYCPQGNYGYDEFGNTKCV